MHYICLKKLNVIETTIIKFFHKAIVDNEQPDEQPIEELEDHQEFIDDNLTIFGDIVNENDHVNDDVSFNNDDEDLNVFKNITCKYALESF